MSVGGEATTIAWRLGRVEERQNSLDDAAGSQGVTLAVHEEKIDELKGHVTQLATTVNKAVWALVGFALTIASSAAIVALTVASG